MPLSYSWCVRWIENPEDAVRFRGEALDRFEKRLYKRGV